MRWSSRSLPVLLALAPLACGDVPSAGDSAATQDSGESEASTDAETSDTETGDAETSDTGEPESCADLPGPWDSGYAIAKQAPMPGDPDTGLEVLLESSYVSCGIPWNLFSIVQPFMGTFTSGPKLDWRPGKNADVPVGWNVVTLEDNSELVVPNCLNCHAAEFDGELILGLGRHDADFTTDLGAALQLAPALPPLNDAGAQFNKFLERYAVVGPPSTMLTVGTNPAIVYAIVLVSHRNPFTLAWQDESTLEIPANLHVPADPPPWWRAKKKATHFINGMSRGDHRGTMVLASSLCTDSTQEAFQIMQDFVHVQAWLESLEAPAYPRDVDPELAALGAEVFECHCQGCHGTYDADDPDAETYPNLLVPLDVIGTDPVMAGYAAGEYAYLEDWFHDSYFGTVTDLAVDDPFVGYVAPPLDGIWASAPFFHNGSVPSLELVLDSSARPTYWRRLDYDSTHFDWVSLGWPWQETGPRDDAPVNDRKYIYDTTKTGHQNGGHTFGDALDPGERQALLEYLKTI